MTTGAQRDDAVPGTAVDLEIDELIEQGVADLDHEYAVYVRLHADRDWPEGALRDLVADLRTAHPRIESVDAPEHDVVVSVDGDGLDAESAAQRALVKVEQAAARRGLAGHAADVTVISDSAVWVYDRETVASW
ncbi:hypothetical protein [Kineococcus indalonis]|uniref:hypothetical protein n=1 Tax=Kineococcus indalonis TaxID=2696566 RepID=UPI0014126759|nr:hypothetical protein [Kineococcus indalonis]NAZ85863.1 hypothetical protein [Kineococcus indalonis]